MVGSLFKETIGGPLRVIFSGLVGDFDKLGEGGNDSIALFIKNSVDKVNAFVAIEFCLHIFNEDIIEL